jgi:hypothetical protein
VLIAFRNGDRYGDIECDNDGDIVRLISDGHGTVEARAVAHDPAAIEEATEAVLKHVDG